MSRESVKKTIIRILQEHLDPKNEITEDTDLVRDLGADSLDNVELAMALEDEFDITISDDEAANALTVSDLITLVLGKAEVYA